MLCKIKCYRHEGNSFRVNENALLDELSFFSIIVESDETLEDHVLLLTDIPLKLKVISQEDGRYIYTVNQESVRQYFSTQDFDRVFDIYMQKFYISDINKYVEFYKLFINYPIGICEIALLDDLNGDKIESFSLNITSSKIDSNEFSMMVSYVESKGSSIWAPYSLLRHKAEGNFDDSRLDWMIIFCHDFIRTVKDKYLSLFNLDKIQILVPKGQVEEYHYDSLISQDSINWLLNNLDVLNPTTPYDISKIIVNNRSFTLQEVMSDNLVEVTDVSENRLVHAFFTEIHKFLAEVIAMFESAIRDRTNKTFDGQILYYSFRRKLKDLYLSKALLTEIKYYLTKEIPVNEEIIDFTHLNKIESKDHYYYVYKKALDWISNKNAIFSVDNRYFKGISRLDELFERACYFKLIETFTSLGYHITNLSDDNDSPVNKKLTFAKGKVTHALYFQKLPEELITIKKGRGSLLPDFVIQLDYDTYIIIDAKYKKDRNIAKYDYPELTLKYLHGIGSIEPNRFKSLALLMLYPSKNNTVDFYQKNEFGIQSISPSLPLIGSVGINFENSADELQAVLKQLIDLFHIKH